MEQALPFVQAAAGRGGGILRIQGQQNHFVAVRRPELRNGFAGKRMPVAHGHKAARIQSLLRQLGLERQRLPFGEAPDGRASANRRIVVLHFAGARGRNQFCQRFASDAGERESQ